MSCGQAMKPDLQPNAAQSHFNFAKQGNQGSRKKTAKITDLITARRKSTEWSAFGKTCCAATYRVRRLPEIRFLELAKGFEPPTP